MKTVIYILIAIVIVGCGLKENTTSSSYCDQELELLKGHFEDSAVFDFKLNKDEQFDNIQSQIEKDICSGFFAFNGQFILTGKDTLNILTIVERYREGYVHEGPVPSCVLIRSQQVIINENNDVLIQNEPTDLDSLVEKVAMLSKEFFIVNQFRPATFEIDWDERSSISVRKLVFERVIKGALNAANELSILKYQKKLCDLDENEMSTLKSDFLIAISLDYPSMQTLPQPLSDDKYLELEK